MGNILLCNLMKMFLHACWTVCFFFPPLFSRRRSINTRLLYWAASRHRLFLYWPVSRCACGREGVSPDLPLPGWEAADWHGGGSCANGGGRAGEGLRHGCGGPGCLGSLGAGWQAAGIGGVERWFGEHLAEGGHVGVVGAILGEQAGREGVHGGMAEQSGPWGGEGCCQGCLQKRWCLSCFGLGQ